MLLLLKELARLTMTLIIHASILGVTVINTITISYIFYSSFTICSIVIIISFTRFRRAPEEAFPVLKLYYRVVELKFGHLRQLRGSSIPN